MKQLSFAALILGFMMGQAWAQCPNGFCSPPSPPIHFQAPAPPDIIVHAPPAPRVFVEPAPFAGGCYGGAYGGSYGATFGAGGGCYGGAYGAASGQAFGTFGGWSGSAGAYGLGSLRGAYRPFGGERVYSTFEDSGRLIRPFGLGGGRRAAVPGRADIIATGDSLIIRPRRSLIQSLLW